MKLEQLRGFLEIAATASFRRAAERLNTTQPTLSARIKTLEELLGCALFDRAPRGIRLTAAGERFLRHAEIAVAAMEQGRRHVGLAGGLVASHRIGLHSYLADSYGRAFLQGLGKALPNQAISLEVGHSEPLIRAVEASLLDCALVYVPKMVSELDAWRLEDQVVRLVATPGLDFRSAHFVDRYVQVYWGVDFLEIQSHVLGDTAAPRFAIGSPALAASLILKQGGGAYLDPVSLAEAMAAGRIGLQEDAPFYRRRVYLIGRAGDGGAARDRVAEIFSALLAAGR